MSRLGDDTFDHIRLEGCDGVPRSDAVLGSMVLRLERTRGEQSYDEEDQDDRYGDEQSAGTVLHESKMFYHDKKGRPISRNELFP